MQGTLFSGEPLPLAPNVRDNELSVFHRKLLDYLRRLGAKLEQVVGPGGGGGGTPGENVTTIKHVGCYIDANQNLAGTYTAIDWTNTLWIDSDAFTHAGAYISVVKTGMYLVHCDVELGESGYSSADLVLSVSNSDGTQLFYPIYGYATLNFGNNSVAICIPLLEGKTIAVLVRCPLAPASGQIKAQGTRLTVLRLRDELGTNDGEGWNDPDDDGVPEPWGLAQL